MEQLANKNIVIISPEKWSHIKVSKHHYASELSKNNNVYFINPPGDKLTIHSINLNLKIVDYKIVRGLNKLPKFIQQRIQKKQIKRIKKELNLDRIDIIWSFDPFVFQNLRLFDPTAFTIFHPVDVHLTNLDLICATNANLVLSTASEIMAKYKSFNPNCYQINHGLSEHFVKISSTKKIKKFIKDKNIRIGYVGNLSYKYLDYQKLIRIIRSQPDVTFDFIGNKTKNVNGENSFEEIEKEANTNLLGVLTPEEVSNKIQEYDGFLLCYTNPTDFPILANPHKVLEYLSTGKAIISQNISEYKNHTELVEMYSDNEDVVTKFEHFIENLDELNSIELQSKRISYALENTYAKQINRIADIISKTRSKSFSK